MKIKLKKELRKALEAPAPRSKKQFLKQLCYPKITYREFLIGQLRYIRKRVWCSCALSVWIVWNITQYFWMDEKKIWIISACLPFLALISITELYRSSACHMAELEESCRFGLPQLAMARMSILGAANSAALLLVLILTLQVSDYGLVRTTLYMMVPYLLVCTICLWIMNAAPDFQSVFICGTAAGLVSAGGVIGEHMSKILYSGHYLYGWITLFTGCVLVSSVQIYQFRKKMRDRIWNLSWIG